MERKKGKKSSRKKNGSEKKKKEVEIKQWTDVELRGRGGKTRWASMGLGSRCGAYIRGRTGSVYPAGATLAKQPA